MKFSRHFNFAVFFKQICISQHFNFTVQLVDKNLRHFNFAVSKNFECIFSRYSANHIKILQKQQNFYFWSKNNISLYFNFAVGYKKRFSRHFNLAVFQGWPRNCEIRCFENFISNHGGDIGSIKVILICAFDSNLRVLYKRDP